MTAKAKENKEVIIRNEEAIDHTMYYVDGFKVDFTNVGVFKMSGFTDNIEKAYEERYINGKLETNGIAPLRVARVEAFEIILTPSLAIQLYQLLGNQLKKYGIPTELPHGQVEVKTKPEEYNYIQ